MPIMYPLVAALTLANTGNQPLEISRIYFSGEDPQEFRVSTDCDSSVAPGASCSLTVTFVPYLPGGRSAQIIVEDNAPEARQTLEVYGFGAGPVPLSKDFGEAPAGTSVPLDQTVTLKVPGSPTDLAVALENGSEFSLLSSPCSAGPSKTTCTARVRLHPKHPGVRVHALTARDSAGNVRAETYLHGIRHYHRYRRQLIHSG
jgi:hypothetical protein